MENYPKLINPQDNSTIFVKNPTFSIGRSLSCDHVIHSLGVSRFHCILRKTGTKWTICDRSTNGTLVNTNLLKFNEVAEIKDSDVIKLGSEELIFKEDIESNSVILLEDVLDVAEEFEKPFGGDPDEPTSSHTDSGSQLDLISNEQIEPIASNVEVSHVDLTTNSVILSDEKFCDEPTASHDLVSNEPIAAPSTSDLDAHMDDELTCTICSELFIKAVTLNCSHSFCKFCLDQWMKNKANCPICRARISSVNPTLVLDNFIEKFLSGQPEEVRNMRSCTVKQREEEAVAHSSKKNDDVIQINSDDDDSYDMDYDDYGHFGYSDDEEDDDDDEDHYYYMSPRRRPYYGGYGRCYNCNEEGHWANTCPNRRRR